MVVFGVFLFVVLMPVSDPGPKKRVSVFRNSASKIQAKSKVTVSLP